MDLVNWNEAPDDATHHLRGRHGSYWIKIDNGGGYHYKAVEFNIDWIHHDTDFHKLYEGHHWTVTPRPQIQPKQQGEHKMFTAKQLRDTYAHKQMRMHIEANIADAAKRPAALGQLVKKFMANCEKEGQFDVPMNVDLAFIWGHTPEGHDFWSVINGYKPKGEVKAKPFVMNIEAGGFAQFVEARVAPVAPKKEAKPAPKQVGWW